MEKRALGRGISALIPEREIDSKDKVSLVNLELVKTNPLQPREYFDEQGMQDLVQSIKEKGVIQPVLVRRIGDNYELIAGERRLRASQVLGLQEIPVIVKEVDDRSSLEISLIENIQRQDLNAIEEARAYQYLMDKFNVTQEKISDVLGKSRSTISNTLRLLKLPQEIQGEIRKGRISFAHGRALLEIEDLNHQRRLLHEIITKDLSVRELENLIKLRRPAMAKHRIRSFTSRDPLVVILEEELQQILATKVRIVRRKKRGHILIEFYSQEELEGIINKIKRAV